MIVALIVALLVTCLTFCHRGYIEVFTSVISNKLAVRLKDTRLDSEDPDEAE